MEPLQYYVDIARRRIWTSCMRLLGKMSAGNA